MKKSILTLSLTFITVFSFGQCSVPSGLYDSNLNFYNAEVNWIIPGGAHHYKIRYKIIGTSTWEYKNNIDSLQNSKLLTLLQPLSDYIWQIRSHCDTISVNISQWSVVDTFTTNTSICPSPENLFITNINYNNAIGNWDSIPACHRYKIQYRINGTSTWSNLGPIFTPSTNTLIPLLQQNTTYEWAVMAYYDTTSLLASLWSVRDTFTTPYFVAAIFNPLIENTLLSTQCDTPTGLILSLSQSANEPDIDSAIITSDGGYFNIGSLSIGDTVGGAILNTSSQTIYSILIVGLLAGQNYALIYSYDSTGALIGFFSIENDSSGIKVISRSPNDLNNYTSGFTSELYFTNLFVTPNYAGPLHFYADIKSELNDQFYDTNTIIISCTPTEILDYREGRKQEGVYDLLGRKSKIIQNKVLIYHFSDGTIEKKLIIKK